MSRQNLEAIDDEIKSPELSSFTLFDRDPKVFYDVGITAVLRASTIEVYRQMRRLAWRSDRDTGDMLLDQLISRGFIVARVTQAQLAERSGLSDRMVTNAITDLVQLGWIVRHFEGAKNPADRRYSIGTFHPGAPHTKRARSRFANAGELYCDAWIEELYEALLSHGKKKGFLRPSAESVPVFGGTFAYSERIAFTAAYVKKKHPQCANRLDEK